MKIFLSWSGKRSRALAEALNEWIPQIIQAVEPWMSPDIEKGKRWSSEISDHLEECQVGIICLTKENLESPWLCFEAGALSKRLCSNTVIKVEIAKHVIVREPWRPKNLTSPGVKRKILRSPRLPHNDENPQITLFEHRL